MAPHSETKESAVPMSATDRARIAALTRHAFGDTKKATAQARAGFLAKFEREVDPDGVLAADERARRADRLMQAHMLRLAAKSAEARRKRAAS
jgi:hypothetical protein